MSKVKNFAEELRAEFLASTQEYCYYCLEERNGKMGCCGENHFGTFFEMNEEDQNHLIQEEINYYENWSKK